MTRRLAKPPSLVKSFRVRREPMDQHAANANDGSRLRRPVNRIPQQKRAQSLSLPCPIDPETPHHRHRNRIRHIPPQPRRRLADRDPARRQAVITNNPAHPEPSPSSETLQRPDWPMPLRRSQSSSQASPHANIERSCSAVSGSAARSEERSPSPTPPHGVRPGSIRVSLTVVCQFPPSQ